MMSFEEQEQLQRAEFVNSLLIRSEFVKEVLAEENNKPLVREKTRTEKLKEEYFANYESTDYDDIVEQEKAKFTMPSFLAAMYK